jgi:xylulokinase
VGTVTVLAIDLGTSGVKVAVVDRSGRVLASAGAPLVTIHTPDGGAEQDADEWWRLIGECSRSITTGVDIEAVAVTAQYMSVVPTAADGRPLMHCVMWMDGRGARHHRIAREPGVAELFLERHGMVPFGYDDQGHIAHVREERPDVHAATAAFVEPVDHINHGATEHDHDLVQASGLDATKLPPLIAFDELVGTVTADAAAHLGISSDAVVVTGTVDSITSGIGCGVIDTSACGMIIGTTSVIVTNVDRKDADHANGVLSVPSPLPGRWFVMAENGVGGRALEHWLGITGESFDDAARAAAATPIGSNGVMYQPWLSGSLAPATDLRMRGGFLHVGLETSRADMTRAVYEGVALNAAWLLPHVQAFAAATWDAVRFGGGGATSSLWGQVLADAFGVRVLRLAEPRTTNARGAALLALTQLGHLTVEAIPGLIDVAEEHEPDPEAHAVYEALRERLVELHATLKPFYRR